jgi:hypothetical protein
VTGAYLLETTACHASSQVEQKIFSLMHWIPMYSTVQTQHKLLAQSACRAGNESSALEHVAAA